MARLWGRGLALLLASGCSDGSPLNLGSNAPVGGEAAPATLVGSWKGYAELAQLGDGSDVMKLVVTQNADGSYAGAMVFGNQPPPPPPDPNVGYLPGVSLEDASAGVSSEQFGSTGFVYTASDLTFDGVRVRFSVNYYDLWKTWCAAQTMIYEVQATDAGTVVLPGDYCAPPLMGWLTLTTTPAPTFTVSDSTGAPMQVDGVKEILCGAVSSNNLFQEIPSHVCLCSPTACLVTDRPNAFDMQLNGDRIDGSSSFGNVHFTRVK
jgi:hypothetical protein